MGKIKYFGNSLQYVTDSGAAETIFHSGELPKALNNCDTRNTNHSPSDFFNTQDGIRLDFKVNGIDGLNDGGGFHGNMLIKPYNDISGGAIYQLGFTFNNNLWIRSGINSWGAWQKFYHSGNFNPATKLNVTGGTITDKLMILSGSPYTTPTITLALGDNDTGFNWLGDGSFNIMANNINMMGFRPGGSNIVTFVPIETPNIIFTSDIRCKENIKNFRLPPPPPKISQNFNQSGSILSTKNQYNWGTSRKIYNKYIQTLFMKISTDFYQSIISLYIQLRFSNLKIA